MERSARIASKCPTWKKDAEGPKNRPPYNDNLERKGHTRCYKSGPPTESYPLTHLLETRRCMAQPGALRICATRFNPNCREELGLMTSDCRPKRHSNRSSWTLILCISIQRTLKSQKKISRIQSLSRASQSHKEKMLHKPPQSKKRHKMLLLRLLKII